jgi:formate/nitrite transporter FocA (FNT family)
MVWLLPVAGSARFPVIVTITYLIGVADLAHVIAGSGEVGYATIVGSLSWSEYAFGFMLPALCGNVVGGVVLVALLNHAQVKQELHGKCSSG